jgi:hypothetical protein
LGRRRLLYGRTQKIARQTTSAARQTSGAARRGGPGFRSPSLDAAALGPSAVEPPAFAASSVSRPSAGELAYATNPLPSYSALRARVDDDDVGVCFLLSRKEADVWAVDGAPVLLGRKPRTAGGIDDLEAFVRFRCPKHGKVRTHEPGSCHLCGAPLVSTAAPPSRSSSE